MNYYAWPIIASRKRTKAESFSVGQKDKKIIPVDPEPIFQSSLFAFLLVH